MRSSAPTTHKPPDAAIEVDIGGGTLLLRPLKGEENRPRRRSWPGKVIQAVTSGLARAIVHDSPVTSRWFY